VLSSRILMMTCTLRIRPLVHTPCPPISSSPLLLLLLLLLLCLQADCDIVVTLCMQVCHVWGVLTVANYCYQSTQVGHGCPVESKTRRIERHHQCHSLYGALYAGVGWGPYGRPLPLPIASVSRLDSTGPVAA
jgi:hypothetical protein